MSGSAIPVVGFAGPIGSGKSAAASALCQWPRPAYVEYAFAAPIRLMLMYGLGLTSDQLHRGKEEPIAWLGGVTPRTLMQTLGTDWGRMMVAPGLWAAVWRQGALLELGDGGRVVAPDVRFPEEAAAIRELGGIVIWIDRPGLTLDPHRSEHALGAADCDYVLANAGDLASLGAAVRRLARVAEVVPSV